MINSRLRVCIVSALLPVLLVFCSVQARSQTLKSTHLPTGALLVSNPGTRAQSYDLATATLKHRVVFELGRENRHWRRVYPKPAQGSLLLHAMPGTDYEVWDTDLLADYVLETGCHANPAGLSEANKLKQLAIRLRELRASPVSDQSASAIRLISDAYQALLGLEFTCAMRYPANSPSADYRIFAGRDFNVTCSVTNHGTETVGPCTMRILAPDEWASRAKTSETTHTIGAGHSVIKAFSVRASGSAMLRPKQYPLIAELSFTHANRRIVVHYPFVVELADPFKASFRMVSARPSRLTAEVSMQSQFPGVRLSNVTASPIIAESIKIEPVKSVSFVDRGKLRVTYTKAGASGPTLRAVTLRMKEGEHLVDLRTVMEARLPLGEYPDGEALWMNSAEDGKTVAATIAGRKCRQTASVRPGGARYIYFAASPNLPTSGNTRVVVTYFDGARGTFRLQYDSADRSALAQGAYKNSANTVQLQGTGAWKTATFDLPDINFANRQTSRSDFRIVVVGADLAVSDLIVSKFPSEDTRIP